MCKKALCLIFAFLFSIESFAAIVSDNDGSAFVTKAEFEALKLSFSDQILNYNNSIDGKIDGFIAAYLSGIKLDKKSVVATGFDLAGKTRKQIQFYKVAGDEARYTNELYGQDKFYGFANGGYSAGPDFFDQDGYDNWVWEGTYTRGNTRNIFFLIDGNRCVKNIYYDVRLNINRLRAFYSTTHARDGITWEKIDMVLDLPTTLMSGTSSAIGSGSGAWGYGHGRGSFTDVYTDTVPAKLFYASGSLQNPGVQCIRTPYEWKDQTQLKDQYSIAMSKQEDRRGWHFLWAQNQKIRTSDKDWDDISIVAKDKSALQDYTVNNLLRYESGFWAEWAGSLTKTNTVRGYGVRFNELLNSSGNPKWTLNDIYYKELSDAWGSPEKLKYTGGFPVYKATDGGTLEFSLSSSGSPRINFTKTQHSSMPASTDTDLVAFDYKRITSSDWTKNVKNLNVSGDGKYDFKVELEKNDILYLNVDSSDVVTVMSQPKEATFTS